MTLNAIIGGGGKDRGNVKHCNQRSKEMKQELWSAFHNTS